ncbi:MAG: hypothetical protein CMN77_01240 [Spirochaetaceae bacterium]|nr:hypothetical protein [Spirochaetaceae bacterium]
MHCRIPEPSRRAKHDTRRRKQALIGNKGWHYLLRSSAFSSDNRILALGNFFEYVTPHLSKNTAEHRS